MISKEDHLKKILRQTVNSYDVIKNLQDQPGDLEVIKKELLRINGFFSVVLKKLTIKNFQSKTLLELQPKIKNYLENYYFIQEIDTMTPLYSEDSSRIKNMRMKVLEALEDKKLIDKLQEELEII